MSYLGRTPSQATRARYYYTATGGETSLSGSDDNGNTLVFSDGNYVDVMLNGVTLVAGTDYNTTTANTIGGLTALTASDVVEVVVYDTFSVFGGNVNGNFNIQNGTLTAETVTASGLVTAQDGLVVDNDGATVATFDRATSNGTIVDFQKDGSSVGSIGNNGSVMWIASPTGSGAGLRFDSGDDRISPTEGDGTNRNGAIDLGYASSRFKDLYLSGGVYLGGTGAANYLDDYEEGTFTPSAEFGIANPTAGATTGYGNYTKKGRIVHVDITIQNINVTGASGDLKITNLPFNSDNDGNIIAYHNGNVFLNNVNVAADAFSVTPEIQDGLSEIEFRVLRDNALADTVDSSFCSDGVTDVRVGLTYEAAN